MLLCQQIDEKGAEEDPLFSPADFGYVIMLCQCVQVSVKILLQNKSFSHIYTKQT